jgi:hypothetical protein
MKLRNGKDTEKKRVRIREELSTNIFLYINKEMRKDYFKTSLTDYKINLIFRKEIMQQLKTEIETIEI